MEPNRLPVVDPLGRRASEVSAKLSRWLKDRKLPVEASAEAHTALQRLRVSGMQIVPNLHQALSVLSNESAAVLTLTAIDSSIEAMHALLGVLPTDPRAFSVVDDLMTFRDEVADRFPDARRAMLTASEDWALTSSFRP